MSFINTMLTVQNLALMNQIYTIQNMNTMRLMQMGCLRIPIPVEEKQEGLDFEQILKMMVIGFAGLIGLTVLFLLVR